ncbi:MAG TPA: hypothetical protein VEQ37_12790 [Actinomycetota bacterium]|nr:hypothetical protein [Actinomycetota bacterium]
MLIIVEDDGPGCTQRIPHDDLRAFPAGAGWWWPLARRGHRAFPGGSVRAAARRARLDGGTRREAAPPSGCICREKAAGLLVYLGLVDRAALVTLVKRLIALCSAPSWIQRVPHLVQNAWRVEPRTITIRTDWHTGHLDIARLLP